MKLEQRMYRRDEIDYDAIPAINQSVLKELERSPLHFAHRLGASKKPTAVMRLGTVAHTAVLEPHRMVTDYVAYQPEPGKKDVFKGKHFDDFCAAHWPKQVIKQAELEEALRISEAVRRNELAARYLKRFIAEPILVWKDEKTGIMCKARLDGISESVPDVMVELKTARDVAPWGFSSAFAKAGYHIQTAFYREGYKAIFGRELFGKCIAVENTEPNDTIVYDLAEVVDVGAEKVRELLDKLHACKRSNRWPGQSPDTEQVLQLPKWLDGDEEPLSGLGLEWGGDDA